MKSWFSRRREKRRQQWEARFLSMNQAAAERFQSNIKLALQAAATRSTAEYVRNHMFNVQSVTSWEQVHDIAIEHVTLEPGLVLEFGVFKGKTITHIANRKSWHVDGFDSFEGLPDVWRDGYPKASFSLQAKPSVPQNVTLHEGWFDNTIPQFLNTLADSDTPIAYLHVDCDLYSSTKTIFDLLSDRIVAGTVIVFDEYFNYDGWEDSEFKAFQEYVQSNAIEYNYLTYNHEHQQVAVLIT